MSPSLAPPHPEYPLSLKIIFRLAEARGPLHPSCSLLSQPPGSPPPTGRALSALVHRIECHWLRGWCLHKKKVPKIAPIGGILQAFLNVANYPHFPPSHWHTHEANMCLVRRLLCRGRTSRVRIFPEPPSPHHGSPAGLPPKPQLLFFPGLGDSSVCLDLFINDNR